MFRRTRSGLALFLLFAAACSSRSHGVTPPDAGVDGGGGSGSDASMMDADIADAAPLDAAPPDAVSPDAIPPGPDGGTRPACIGGASYYYVVADLDVAQADPAGPPNVVPGFNLDGEVSDGSMADTCHTTDYTAPDGTPGIDNQLGPILGSLDSSFGFTSAIRSNIDSGILLVIAELDGVDSFTDDSCVTLSLLKGVLPSGASVMLDSSGGVAPGQTFDIDPTSYMADGVTPVTSAQGQITGGHFTAGPFEWALDLPTAAGTIPLDLHETRVAADVTATAWMNGVVGGRLDNDAIIAAVGATMPSYTDIVRTIVQGQADLDYDPTTMMCKSISIAMVFDTVTCMRGVGM